MTGAGEAGRYVDTKAIRDAVRGREAEILDALDIKWHSGRPHIQCPYPAHDDHQPSWRWDHQRRRAYCTCIEKSDGIFDVTMKVWRLDFGAAKLFVAERLHRDDLIKTKGEGGTGQRQDPQSLLNPPIDNLDNGFPYLYLGARLELEIDQVPSPSTKMVGIASLPYYDAPSRNGKSAKPVLVGRWPCIAFETIAADGRSHAHRIYVSADGLGKAKLGQDAAGKQRDPKKSATRQPGQPSTVGTCVVWGNADVKHVVLAEGIENAAAVAYSFLPEINKGELAVLSAINAGGIEAFMSWPSTRRITIAADRDEAKPGAGFRRGEKAARNLALRLGHEAAEDSPQILTLIALPGESGTNYDFLDLFRASGPDDVRNTILAAQPFQPSVDEITEFERRAQRKSELEQIAGRYPQPSLINLKVEYRHTEDHRVWLHKYGGFTEDDETGERSDIWEAVSSPFGALVQLAMPGRETAYGLRVHIHTRTGKTNSVDFLWSELPKPAASSIRDALMGAGLRVANGGETTVLEILKQAEPNDCVEVAGSFGWHQTDNYFLTPGGKQC
jgi:hypothetical protein